MKITCNSCGSKYTIADAKVQGRKVKVRCKSCKSTILVDGTAPGEPDDEAMDDEQPGATALSSIEPVRKDTWSVNLTDDDSRDMSTAEIIAGWKSGLITVDAYAWKDGMDDWKPVLEIPELRQKLLVAKPLQPEGVVSSARMPASQPPGGGADLFGGVDLIGGDVELGGAHPSLPGGLAHKKAAGERNESSVLFSLDALTGGGGGGAGPGQPAPMRSSGNVDLFGGMGGGGSLVANTDLLTAPAKEPPPAPRISMPAMAGGATASTGKGGLIAAVIALLVIVGGGAAYVLSGAGGPSEAEVAATRAAEEARVKAEEEAQKKSAEAEKIAAELKKAQAALAKAQAEDTKETAAGNKPAERKEEAKAEATAPSSDPSPSASSTASSDTPAAASSAKPGFNVSAAKSALATAAAGAASCKKPGGPTGAGKVQVTFAPSGRATSATVVSGPFGGTPTGSCVASTFRRARIPPFSGDAKTVAKSFSIP